MAIRALLLVALLSGCSAKFTRQAPPDELYRCKPTVRPQFAETTDPRYPYGLSKKESGKFKTMIAQTEVCLSKWREFSR